MSTCSSGQLWPDLKSVLNAALIACKIRRALNSKFPSLCSHGKCSLSQKLFLSWGPDIVLAYLWVARLSSMPAHEVIQSHTSMGTKGNLSLLILWLTPSHPTYSPCFQMQHPVALNGPPLGYEYMGLINCCPSHLSNIACWMFGHLYNPRILHQWYEKEMIKTRRY